MLPAFLAGRLCYKGLRAGRSLDAALLHEQLNDTFDGETKNAHGEGEVEDEGAKAACVMLLRQIPDDEDHEGHQRTYAQGDTPVAHPVIKIHAFRPR